MLANDLEKAYGGHTVSRAVFTYVLMICIVTSYVFLLLLLYKGIWDASCVFAR